MKGELKVNGSYVIQRMEPSQAIETLGVQIAVDGNWREEIEALRENPKSLENRY